MCLCWRSTRRSFGVSFGEQTACFPPPPSDSRPGQASCLSIIMSSHRRAVCPYVFLSVRLARARQFSLSALARASTVYQQSFEAAAAGGECVLMPSAARRRATARFVRDVRRDMRTYGSYTRLCNYSRGKVMRSALGFWGACGPIAVVSSSWRSCCSPFALGVSLMFSSHVGAANSKRIKMLPPSLPPFLSVGGASK